LTLSIESMGVQALANLFRTIAEDYPLGIVEGTAGGTEIYPHGVGSRRAPFDLDDDEPSGAAPALPAPPAQQLYRGMPAPFRCAVDGCGKAFPTRHGVLVHQVRMHRPAPPDAAAPVVETLEESAIGTPEPAVVGSSSGSANGATKRDDSWPHSSWKPSAGMFDEAEADADAEALPLSSYCRRGECQTCRQVQARCGHACHPDSRQLPPT
jgi:hypothetical protein